MAARQPLSADAISFWQKLIQELVARFSDTASDNGLLDTARPHLLTLAAAQSEMDRLKHLGLSSATEGPSIQHPDESALLPLEEQWYGLVFGDLVDSWGSAGFGSVTSVSEALSISHALALNFAAGTTDFHVYYRGEPEFGWPLRSRAEREIGHELSASDGLSERELQEIARFQDDVLDDLELRSEVFQGADPLDRADPEWLAIMQHYDQSFGTRMLDLTSSIFAGLHFASIGWDGLIDESKDGLLYVFLGTRSWRHFSHPRSLSSRWEFVDDITEVIPDDFAHAFAGWEHPEIPRLYEFPIRNPRLVAQDGVFLIPGQAGVEQSYGQHFKLRIPGKSKLRIARELWIAGYTPERIVRGQEGRDARARVEAALQS